MKWYAMTKPTDRQGLVADETTGRTVAVTYDPKDAAIVAAAPDMLAALEYATAQVGSRVGSEAWAKLLMQSIDAAIAKARGEG